MRKRNQPPVGTATCTFTIESFAAAHNLGRNTVLEELSSGRLKARKVGTRTLITAEDAAGWRQSLPLRGEDRSRRGPLPLGPNGQIEK